MKTNAISLFAAFLVASGCSENGSGVDADSEGWIDTSPSAPPSERPVPGGDDEGEDEEGEDEEGEDEGSGAFWGLSGEYADGQLGADLRGEFFAEQGEQEVCILVFPATLRAAADDCTQCTAAWDIELGEPDEELNADGACQTIGPQQIQGTVLRLGISDSDVLMRDDGDGWLPIGEFLLEESEIFLEWEHEPQ